MELEIKQKRTSDGGSDIAGKEEILDLRQLKVGSGSTIFFTDKEGSRWGSISFDTAKAWIKPDGSFKFTNTNGDVIIDSAGAGGNFVQVINNTLNTVSKKILSDFTFESTDYAGAFKTGTITWDEETGLPTGGTGGVWNAKGLVFVADGVPTITLDTETGSATFAGTVAANAVIAASIGVDKLTAGTISSKQIVLAITAGTGDCAIRAGKTDFTNAETGFILGLDDSDSDKPKFYIGSSTSYLNWDGSSVSIRGTLVTSGTTGAQIKIDASDSKIKFLYDNSEKGYISVDSSGNVIIDGDNLVYLRASGSGDDVYLVAGDYIYGQASDFLMQCSHDASIECDDWRVWYNDDNDNSSCYWYSNDNLEMWLMPGDGLHLYGTMYADSYGDYAEYFEATKEFSKSKLPLGITVVLENDKIRPAKNGESPIGVISSMAGLVLNDSSKEWSNKYIRDDFGEFIYEEAEWWSIEIEEEFTKPTGQNGTVRKKIKGWSDEKLAPNGSIKKIVKRKKVNPKWDSTQQYIPRESRPEWNVVGLIGRVRILKGQPINHTWVKLKDISNQVEEWLIK